jgi:hypothetical protein
MQLEGITPEGRIAKGVKAEDLPTLFEQLLGGLAVFLVWINGRSGAYGTDCAVDDHEGDVKNQPTRSDPRQPGKRLSDHIHWDASSCSGDRRGAADVSAVIAVTSVEGAAAR